MYQGKPVDQAASSSDQVEMYPVEFVPFADTRRVSVQFDAGESSELRVDASGVVTRWECAAGGTWEELSTPIAVDQKLKLVVESKIPFYRNLIRSERGEDVAAVQRFLVRAGFEVPTDGQFGPQTRSALSQLKKDKGIAETPGVSRGSFIVSDVLWVRDAPVDIEECRVSQGQRLTGDTVIATSKALPVAASIAEITNLLPGDRILQFEGESVDFPERRTTDPKTLQEMLNFRSVKFALSQASEDTTSNKPPLVEALYELKDPKQAAPVPPLSLGALNGTRACVTDGTSTYPVEILSSTMGLTYVSFGEGNAPRQVALRAPKGITCD
jgi:peptidoglycan hydrolase-like protein with peptidoglycan-binding domain